MTFRSSTPFLLYMFLNYVVVHIPILSPFLFLIILIFKSKDFLFTCLRYNINSEERMRTFGLCAGFTKEMLHTFSILYGAHTLHMRSSKVLGDYSIAHQTIAVRTDIKSENTAL